MQTLVKIDIYSANYKREKKKRAQPTLFVRDIRIEYPSPEGEGARRADEVKNQMPITN